MTDSLVIGGFVDIHCHILPGIDDGARDRAESVEMLRMAHEQNTTIIATTPHNFPRSTETVLQESQRRVEALSRAAAEHHIPISLLTGQEIRITSGFRDQLVRGDGAVINETSYVLSEPPFNSYPDYVEEQIEEIIALGYRPVIAHPERNTIIQRDPDLVYQLLERGALMQINIGSLLDHYGPGSREAGEYLLKRELAHVLATDAHGATGSRVPNMRTGYETAAELVGEEQALLMTRDNPLAITEGRDIPYRPPVSVPEAVPGV